MTPRSKWTNGNFGDSLEDVPEHRLGFAVALHPDEAGGQGQAVLGQLRLDGDGLLEVRQGLVVLLELDVGLADEGAGLVVALVHGQGPLPQGDDVLGLPLLHQESSSTR